MSDERRGPHTGRGGAQVAVERARILMAVRRHLDAERELRRALSDEPQHAEAHAVLAVVLAGLDRSAESVIEAHESVRLAPDWWYPHYVVGRVFYNAGHNDEALQAALAATKIDPTVSSVWTLIARVHMARRELVWAMGAIREGLAHDPENSELLSLMSIALINTGDVPGALAWAERAVSLAPESPFAHLAYGFAVRATDKPERAYATFREALRLDPTMDAAREALVETVKRRNSLYRSLFDTLHADTHESWLPFWIWAVLFACLTVAHWALWVLDAILTTLMSYHRTDRHLLPFADVRVARLCSAVLCVGCVIVLAGFVMGVVSVGWIGVATLGLATPIQEAHAQDGRLGKRLLLAWSGLLAVVLACSLVMTLSAASPDSVEEIGFWVGGAAILTVWAPPRVRKSWAFGRRADRSAHRRPSSSSGH
ncbi:tetratricopeptide repeat protein [Rhodococcus tibetensis]|uniref:Tetratricopeptide repeat protein n=1 Tax=Rhodococcus tibetensis TaxID=2965064 RepID=A0ABT1QF92_9NOCA|nr:tetratricopeptide repeat protein [Rhodococcus sp. FXJ9.536]MCQ4120946.1 tetratricopeptide repeat protein [Rhodococcus sp. FXJ9.536]